MNNLDLISVFQSCLLPSAAGHHRLVEFDSNPLRRQGQRIEQFVERQRALWELALLAVDLNAHDGFLSSRRMNDAAQLGDFAVSLGAN